MNLSDSFRRYLEEAIGQDNALVAFSAFDSPASSSVRRNPFKSGEVPDGEEVLWNGEGRILEQRPVFTLDPYFHAGAYYVQDSSSMFVGYVFRALATRMDFPRERPLRVLDLCAAPGGKTTDLAASLRSMYGDGFLLVSNEVMKARVGVLADNVALWGDPNVAVTSDDPRAFAALPGFFDVILADVPCSGEGMFRKDEQAQQQWSEDNVALCEARQRRIIADVWPSLAEGGLLIYSTCTFNRRENDGNVEWISENLGAHPLLPDVDLDSFPGVLETEYGYSLVPGLVEGEGQYCSALRKISEVKYDTYGAKSGQYPEGRQKNDIPKDLSRLFDVPVRFRLRKDLYVAVPENIWPYVNVLEGVLHVISAGCAAGTMKGKDFVPVADMALSIMLSDNAYPSVDVDRTTALAFLHRDAVSFPGMERGYLIVRYGGVALGFVKNIGNRCNNLHPQSRRIRMDVK